MHKYAEQLAAAFEDELKKIAKSKQAGVAGVAAPMVAGAALWEWARRANQDRKNGRLMRQQQGF